MWLLLIPALYLGAILGGQRAILFPSFVAKTPDGFEMKRAFPQAEKISLRDGQGEAWLFLAPQNSSDKTPRPLVIYFHGNGENADTATFIVEPYLKRGVSVMIPEYPGYGRSLGQTTKDSILRDASEAYDLVVARPEVDRAHVVFHGMSLGGGVAAEMTRRKEAADLILQSTFTSVMDRAWERGVPGFLVYDRFDTKSSLEKFLKPTLILHGNQDPVIPVAHGIELAKSCPDRCVFQELTGGHNDLLYRDGRRYWQSVDRFLVKQQVLRPTPGVSDD